MLLSEYLRLRNQVTISTGNKVENYPSIKENQQPKNSDFAAALQQELEKRDETVQGVEFSKHAIQRLAVRDINLAQGNLLERLNKGVEIAQNKGSDETLVLVDTIAFVVSVKNNKVITTMAQEDLIGNIFTNIDSTVII